MHCRPHRKQRSRRKRQASPLSIRTRAAVSIAAMTASAGVAGMGAGAVVNEAAVVAVEEVEEAGVAGSEVEGVAVEGRSTEFIHLHTCRGEECTDSKGRPTWPVTSFVG